jgi:AcrR family transcriptional regulator
MTTRPSEPRVDRRRLKTRAALMRAGQTLFAERSVDGVTIDDIVVEADVAKGSFYNHFDDKEGLARAIAQEVRGAAEAAITLANAGVEDPAERVARALCVFVLGALDHPERSRAYQRLFSGATLLDAPMNRGIRHDVEEGLRVGRFVGLSPATGVLMVMGVVAIAASRVLEPNAPANPAAVSRELAFGLLRGLGVENAVAEAIATKACGDIIPARTGKRASA